MEIEVMSGNFAVCQLSAESNAADWVNQSYFWSITGTDQEVSVVCVDENIPADVRKETGWVLMRVAGVLDFSLVGILSSILEPLAKNGISVYTVSTYNTDYILIKQSQIEPAVSVLQKNGYTVRGCFRDGRKN